MPQTSVWAPGTGPQPPKAWSGCGRPPKLLRRDGKHQPISVKKLAFGLAVKGMAQDHVAGSHGGAVVVGCALPVCAFVLRIGINGLLKVDQRSGC